MVFTEMKLVLALPPVVVASLTGVLPTGGEEVVVGVGEIVEVGVVEVVVVVVLLVAGGAVSSTVTVRV